MNIVVFGASGKTGHEIVTQAIPQGHIVTAFVRTPGKLTFTHTNLKVITGDVTDARAVERAITGQHAVFVCVGGGNPLVPYPALTAGLKNIIHGMGLAAVQRLIYLSTIGAGKTQDTAASLCGTSSRGSSRAR